ncbi:MAG: esterase family protein [Chitinophagaceae bacterium]|nr:esterase family protein [Chitinophagaceae bacterium]
MRTIIFALLFLFSVKITNAATVDTVNIFSNAMQKSYKCVVIKPAGYKKAKTGYPVVYLLHGYSGDYANWIKRVPELKHQADEMRLIIVCPDGAYGSWYIDSPVDSSMKFETFVGMEVPEYIDTHYRTINDRSARAITGLSMGGHGGLFLGFRHAKTFGACGSMSGGADIRLFTKNWDLQKIIGDTISHAADWEKYTVINVIDNKPSQPLAVIIDCGTDDFFFSVNKALHEKMLRLKIPHDYIERPGKHDWNYWRNAVKFQLLFFKENFNKK